ncbi:low temperature requirement protein A [Micromonospora sp. NPDC051006]|uniref:low temperature requirement protein A n=1 Tax=Micromonospora sp. NPDC051006 TaxID=3364283 RepID=UPI0037A1B648
MAASRWRDVARVPAGRVTPVEIFFDLVFIFTLIQLTRILEHDLSVVGVGHVLLLFGILWWMFGGYVWLPNHVPPRSAPQKLLLFVAMVGFLTAAVAVPEAFAGAGIAFGVGYLVAVIVHLVLFAQADVGRVVRWLAPYNIGAALLVLAGGVLSGTAQYVLWLTAVVLQWVAPYLVPRISWMHAASSFHLAPAHLVERHGLLVIIALGESVVAIGMGANVRHSTVSTVAVVALALALPAALWWTYFADVDLDEEVLADARHEPRARLALRLGFAHVPLLLGIVVAAAGVHAAVAHPGERVAWQPALALAGGVAVYLVGIAVSRHALHAAEPWSRLVTAAVVLATVPVGVAVNAGLQLAAVAALVAAMLAVDRTRPAGTSADAKQA